MRLGAVARRDHEGHDHHMVTAQHRPGGEQHHDPRQQRQVRVPRLRQRHLPVAAHDEGEERADDGDAAPAETAVPDPQRRRHGGEMDGDRRRLERPRRRAEGAVGGGEQVEAERARMAALVGEGPDAAGEPDERGVGAEHVTDSVLGHRQVENRVPLRSPQRDECDEQGEADDGGGGGDRSTGVPLGGAGQPRQPGGGTACWSGRAASRSRSGDRTGRVLTARYPSTPADGARICPRAAPTDRCPDRHGGRHGRVPPAGDRRAAVGPVRARSVHERLLRRPGAGTVRGHLDVPADVVAIEGFVVDGETHLYYGLAPALARLPIAAVTDGGERPPGGGQPARRARRGVPRRCPPAAAGPARPRHRRPGAVVAVDDWWLRRGGRAVHAAAVAVVASDRVPRGRALGCGAGAARVRPHHRVVGVETDGGPPVVVRGRCGGTLDPRFVRDRTAPRARRPGGGRRRSAGTGGWPGGWRLRRPSPCCCTRRSTWPASTRRSACRSTSRCSTTSPPSDGRPSPPTTARCSASSSSRPPPCSTCGLTRSRHERWRHGSRGTGGRTSSATSRSTPSTARPRSP